MVENARFDLEEHNPLYDAYRSFAEYRREDQHAYMELELADVGTGREIAAPRRQFSNAFAPQNIYTARFRCNTFSHKYIEFTI